MTFQDLDSFLKTSLSCTICLDIFRSPHTIKCGHTFCGSCLIRWLENALECPICRTKISQEPVPNLILNNQIDYIRKEKDASTQRMSFSWNRFIKQSLKDDTDGIVRCSVCHWEIVDDECQCTDLLENIDETFEDSLDDDIFSNHQFCNCNECHFENMYMMENFMSDDESEDLEYDPDIYDYPHYY